MTFLLVLGLTSCGEKAVSQDVSIGDGKTLQPISQQFSEVSPPSVIQELRPTLEIYQPQVTIVTPKADEVLQDNQVQVQLQVKDLPIFKDPQLGLGPHLEVILDNQSPQLVYDLNQPLILPDLPPGTHTLRVFASRPWNESFKNEGAYAQTTFHILVKTEDNKPDLGLPLLTYNRPEGDYGAEPILLDFYLTNAPLHLVATENPHDEISNWRIRCTINGENFVFDRWQEVYLKGFKPGKNWVKLEFLDNRGDPLKNAFNTTVRLINYQPKGQDTLSRIVRGELSTDQVRGIVDADYAVKIEPVSTPSPTEEAGGKGNTEQEAIPERPQTQLEQPKPELPEIVVPSPSATPTPAATQLPEIVVPSPSATPTPEATQSPEIVVPSPRATPTPEATQLPQKVVPKPQRRKFSEYFQRRPRTRLPKAPSEVAPTPEISEQ